MGMVSHDILQEPVHQATGGNVTPSSPHYLSVPGTHEVLWETGRRADTVDHYTPNISDMILNAIYNTLGKDSLSH